MTINKHWGALAITLAAGAINYSGHDGWGFCLVIVFLIEYRNAK
jgi:hypothetical protein